MAAIIGGGATGLLDSSLYLLNRRDQTSSGSVGHGESIFVNVSNGDLVLQHQDAFLPSEGEDFLQVRTYNSRGAINTDVGKGWTLSVFLNLDQISDSRIVLVNPDSSRFTFEYDSKDKVYRSVDGPGAYETIVFDKVKCTYTLTRSNQTRLTFDADGKLLRSQDTNGNEMTYRYDHGNLVSIEDDDGHVICYCYDNGKLTSVKDETGAVLVCYEYDNRGLLVEVTDRDGHRTKYCYNDDCTLQSVTLPCDDDTESRTIAFEYCTVFQGDGNEKLVLSALVDAECNRTEFDYSFNLVKNKYQGGTTRMINALGVDRMRSNDDQYVAWRLANGYYQYWSDSKYDSSSSFRAQANAIRDAYTTTFSFDPDGAILSVTEPRGFTAFYQYDTQENLTAIVDANADAITRSDDAYYRGLRQSLGIVNTSTGQGKLVSELTSANITALKDHFTTRMTYDTRGNQVSSRDGEGNLLSYTYTSFNKIASQTTAIGNALVSSDAAAYLAQRAALGYIDPATGQGKRVAQLSSAEKQALLALYTTKYAYDGDQNLIEVRGPEGALTRYAYDSFGNVATKTVYTDPADLTSPAKQQVTRFSYDAFGNAVKTTDAEGAVTRSTYDHFGNRLTFTDANGGVTTFTYDDDNRLLSITNAEGQRTVNAYDAVGNRVSFTDANGHTVCSFYDRNNLLIRMVDPADSSSAPDRTTKYQYDVVGNRTTVLDAEGRKTTYVYREDNRLVQVITPPVVNAAGQSVTYTSSYAYDAVGNRITVTDNNGNVTSYVYNADNLVTQTRDALGHVTQYSYDANLNRVSVLMGAELAPLSRRLLTFRFDKRDELVAEFDALGNSTAYAYDAAGNRVRVTDANGHTTDFVYDRDNRLIKEIKPEVIDPATGNAVRYTVIHQYDANGNQVATTDQAGHTTSYSFDKSNRMVMVTDANGIRTVYSYDSRNNRTAVKIGVQAHLDSKGRVVVDSTENARVTTYSYDEFNQLVAQTDGLGNALVASDAPVYLQMRKELGYVNSAGQGKTVAQLSSNDKKALLERFTEHYTYDRVGNYTSTSDHLDRTTRSTYDALNRLTVTTDALGQTTRYAYDGNGNRVRLTDAGNHATQYAYDALNRLTNTTDALGVVTRRDYDAFGNVSTQTQANGTAEARVTRYIYDLDNRLVTQTDPGGHSIAYEYDAIGNRLKVVDARGNATRYVYDALDRNVRIIDPLGFQTRFEYDGAGNRISLIDARGGLSRFTFDPGNRLLETLDAEGRRVRFTYDVRGNRVLQTTASGTPEAETTAYLYDAENHLLSVTDAEGRVSTTRYDAVYNRIQSSDANGRATSYAYDALNREIRVTDALGNITRYSYDAVGNRLSISDAKGGLTQYAYDARNQLLTQTDALGVQTRYAYDRVGNRIGITQAANTALAATTLFVYNRDDQLVAQTDALGRTTSYAYDADHNRVAVTDALGNATSYAYDADNRVSSITDALGNVTRYTYDGNGNRVQVTDARGYTSTTYYNRDNEVALSVDNEGNATGFSYDHNGNVLSQTVYATRLALPVDPAVQPSPAASAGDQTVRFAYDHMNRLLQRSDGEGFVTLYAYDAVGNRLETRQALDPAATQFAVRRSYYDAVNREMASLTAEGYLSVSRYDAIGNRVARTEYDQKVAPPASGGPPQPAAGDLGRTTTFAYDANNRLVRQTSALGVSTAYEYDARGNRTAMTEAAGSADARRTAYRYDAANRYVETTNALGVITRLELDAVGNVLTRREAFGTAQERAVSFVYDGNNRVVSQTDPLGLVTRMGYDANGNLMSRTVAVGLADARTETFGYDGNNRQTLAANGAGQRTIYAYDGAGNRIRVTQAPGLAEERSNTYAFDRDNHLVAAADAIGTVSQYRYDGAGNKIATIQPLGTGARESFYAYDKDNRLTQVVDPAGSVTRYEYDALGNQTRSIDANGGVQSNSFDVLGRLLSSTSAGGVLTRNTYDLRDNILSTTQSFANGSDARTTAYAYDLLDRQTRITDGEGFSTTITYDAFGNQSTITRGQYLVPAGDPSYDPAKAARTFVETNTFHYDADNRMLSLTDAVGNITSYGYDAAGNRVSMTEASNSAPRTTRYMYDLANRQIQVVTPEGGITRSGYDGVGNRISQDQLQSGDAATGVWIHNAFTYDANGRVTAEIDPYGVRTEHSYDAVGNLVSTRFAAGTAEQRSVRMEYDRDNRKTADIDALGNRTTYAYDALGNRIKLTDPLGHVAHYYYDAVNQLTAVADPDGILNTFKFDAAGNRIEERVAMTRVTGPIDDRVPPSPPASSQDRVVSKQYDRANRMIVDTEADGSRTELTYDGAGNKVQERQFANTGAPRILTYVYDLDNRLTGFTDIDGTVTTFTYDGASNRLSEIISSPGDANPVRATFYQYDLNNRRTREAFDPTGLNITLSTVYDKIANVVSKTDGGGHATTYSYDLDNRQLSSSDALGATTHFAYDRLGNRITATDARGNTTNFVYDANNREIQVLQPLVDVYTIADGLTSRRPTTTRVYDAVGSQVQTVDPNGFTTTGYFDADGRLVARLSGDNVLREYAYNAAGDMTSETLYMTRLTASDHNPAVRPTPPAGEARVITREYDARGRLTRTVYPSIAVTTLTDTGSSNPTPVTVTRQVEERKTYDAFGNEVETFDREGHRAVTYYDVKGRKVAVVDALGYLVEWDYDAQGNQTAQRVYTQPLDPATVTPGVRPAPPAGDPHRTDRSYDASSRLVRETAPQIDVFDPVTQTSSSVRPVTTFTYDQAGNQLSKTLGAGTAQAITEYSYYDAANRRVALVNGGRVLHLFQYDANGNLAFQKRFFDTIAGSVDLSQLSGDSDFAALVSAAPNDDQATRFTYDALDRTTRKTELMRPGTADDLSQSYRYDAATDRTYLEDEDGYVTQTSYDSVGRLAQSINPDGTGTLFDYDAAGNQIFAYTGTVANTAVPATNINAHLAQGVTLTWNVADNQQTWVVYDSVSHADETAYAGRTTPQISFVGTAQATIAAPATGSTLYFRVFTQDGAGNTAWTAEQSIVVPPRFSAVAVDQPDSSTLVVTARFDAGTFNPALAYGAPGSLTQSTPFVLQADGSFKATLTGVTDPDALAFALRWQDAAGRSYSSAEAPFEAQADQVGAVSNVSQGTVSDGTTTTFQIHVATRLPAFFAAGLTVVQAQWRLAASSTGFAATAAAGVDSGSGSITFNLLLGETTTLTAGTYEIRLSGVRQDGTSVLLDTFDFTVGPSATIETKRSLSWIAPPVGDDQLVVIGGLRADSTRDGGRVLVDDPLDSAGTSDYLAFYGERATSSHTLDVTSTAVTQTIPDPSDPSAPPQIVITGYDVAVQAALSTAEAANIGGDLHLAWRPAGSGGDFANDTAVPFTGGGNFAVTLHDLAAGQYDLKLYYTDAQGREVIVEWRRVDTATPSSSFSGTSLTVAARESGGTITLDAQGVLTLDPGTYSGPLDANRLLTSLSLALDTTGNPGGSQDADGRTTGYFTRSTYNALSYKTGTNENDGLWRELDVDGNGRTVATRLFGDQGAASFIATYAVVDARGRTIAEFGAPVPTSSGLTRPVRRYAYDVLDKVTQDTDALGHVRRFEYNALGTLVRETDPLGGVTQTRIDLFGNETASVSQLGHTTLKFYDAQERLTRQRDPLGNQTGYAYDAFDRQTAMTDGVGMATANPDDHTMRYFYDQRDRLVREEQPQGWHLAHDDGEIYQDERVRLGYARHVADLDAGDQQALITRYSATYAYDGRNNRISTLYPLGQRTDQVYDSLGRVADTQIYLAGSPAHNRRAYDAYGNLTAETDGEGRTKTHIYGGFGRLLQDIDEDGNVVAYSYDVYGRATRAFDPNGAKDIHNTYDDGGHLSSVQDQATGVSTVYTYDLRGQRRTEAITTPGNQHDRSLTYQYDALGQLVRWADAVTGMNLNTLFNAEGNRVRAYTDTGYDPLGQNSGANPNYRYIDHVYTFDDARRVTREVQRATSASGTVDDTLVSEFGYDQANNRVTWNNAGTVVHYSYDANDRAVASEYFTGSTRNREAWTYDAVGNVLSYTTFQGDDQTAQTVTQYNSANRATNTTSKTKGEDDQVTTQAYDRSLRITQTVLKQSGRTYTYNHSYFGDGRESSVTAYGDASGSSTTTYDANKIRVSTDLGQGDGKDRPEVKTFVADNEGHLLSLFHDDGKSATPETREYLYANGNPVGDKGQTVDGTKEVNLDNGTYNPVQSLGKDLPAGVLTYTVRNGDTLQGIASQMYGNPSLWYVIADANGLSPAEPLKAGTTLKIPNSVKTGLITADNHKVYSESEIAGSTLPNLKSPPPPKPKHGCGAIIAIIIVVVVAIVVSVVTAGIAAPLAAGAVAAVGAAAGSVAAFVVTAAVYAVVGAVVAAVGSIVQQGLFIALNYQEGFHWNEVASAAVGGAFSGAAQGIGAAAKIAATAGQLSSAGAQYAKVAAAALSAAGAASTQIMQGGKITSWTSLAGAALGGYAQAGQAIAAGSATAAKAAGNVGALNQALASARTLQTVTTYSNYITPWVQLAETYVRNDGKLTPADWANAAGTTLSQAVSQNFGSQGDELGDKLQNASLRLGANALVAGVLSRYDKDAAQSYLENAIGQEAGQFIGDYIGQRLRSYFPRDTGLVYDPTQDTFIDQDTGAVYKESLGAFVGANGIEVVQKNANGQYVDQNGNPTPIAVADDTRGPASAQLVDTSGAQLQEQLDGTTTPADQADAAGTGGSRVDANGNAVPADAQTDNVTTPASRKVQRGDNLSRIASDVYGDPNLWPAIAIANGIDRPDLIRPGQDLVIPPREQINEDAAHELAGKFYAVKERIRQAQIAAMASNEAAAAAQVAAPAPQPAAPEVQAQPSASAVADNGLIPQDGALGATAGVFAGAYRFVEHTVTGVYELSKTVYQSYDYMLTGDPASQAGYERAAQMGQGVANLLSDTVDTYAYLATGDAKYRAGFDSNGARGDAIISAGQKLYQQFSDGSAYEKSAVVTEGVLTIASMFVGVGEVKAAGGAGTVLREAALLDEAAVLANSARVATETTGAAAALEKAAVAARYGSEAERTALLNAVGRTGTLSEAKGVVYGTRRMQELGYELLDESFQYGGGHGLDLVFTHAETGGFAILEAKHGAGLASLSTDVNGLRQGGSLYNESRLQQYIRTANAGELPASNIPLAQDLLRGVRAGEVPSYASFYRGKSLYELKFSDTVNFRLKPPAATLIRP